MSKNGKEQDREEKESRQMSTFRLLGNEKLPAEKWDLPKLTRQLENPRKFIQNQLKGPETADPRETHLDTAGHPPTVFTAD